MFTNIVNVASHTGGIVSVTGNVTGGNVLTGGLISATGTIRGSNILVGGGGTYLNNAELLLTTQNQGGGTVPNATTISGNPVKISGAAYNSVADSGTIAQATQSWLGSFNIASAQAPVTYTNLSTLFVAVPTVGTNVTATNSWAVYANGSIGTTSGMSATANITGGNILTGGLISSTGTITGSSVLGSVVSVSANVTGGNVLTGGLISATSTITSAANITGGNVLTGGLISATGTITGSSVLGSVVSVSANVTGGNLLTAGLISAASTVTGTSHLGAVVSVTGNITGGNLAITGNTATVTTANYSIGYLTVPQVTLSANSTIALTDLGKHYYSTSASNLSLTIANNTSVVWPVGTAIAIVNAGTANILINQGVGVSMYLVGSGTAGNRVLGTYGMATIMNTAANTWFLNGTGVV
jgi:hypothetical protein